MPFLILMQNRLTAISVFLLACCVFLPACTPPDFNERQGLVYCAEGVPETLNPLLGSSGTTFDAVANTVFNRLFSRNAEGEIQGILVDQWHFSPDRKTLTIQLKEDIRFHSTTWFTPTRPLNSADVVFSFERLLSPASPYYVGDKSSYFINSGLSQLLLSVNALDTRSVQFNFQQAAPNVLSLLAMDFVSIFSAEYAEQLHEQHRNESFDEWPIGTGPFQLRRYDKREFLRFTAHQHYFKGATAIKDLVFAITPDAALRLSRLRAGECDVMAQPAPAHLRVLRQSPDLTLITQPSLNVSYWAFNTTKAPLNKPALRQALNRAINKNAIIDAVYFGAAIPAISPLPPLMEGHFGSPQLQDYSPETARKQIADLMQGQTLQIDIWAMPRSRPYNPNAIKMAEMMLADLNRVGVKASVVQYDWPEFIARIKRGEHMTALLGWSADSNDATHFLTPLLSCASIAAGSNRSFWCNQGFDHMLALAQNNAAGEQRRMALMEAQTLFNNELPWTPIAHATQFIALHNSVRGVRLSEAGTISFADTEKF